YIAILRTAKSILANLYIDQSSKLESICSSIISICFLIEDIASLIYFSSALLKSKLFKNNSSISSEKSLVDSIWNNNCIVPSLALFLPIISLLYNYIIKCSNTQNTL